MKQHLRRLCAGLCCLSLLCSQVAVMAAAPSTVHVTAWLKPVYVDGRETGFANAQGRTTYKFSYHGTVYMPANTAAAWLGCQLTVDQAAQIASFISGGEAHIPTPNDAPILEDEDFARLNRYFEQGVDTQLLTGFTVLMDGKPWTLSSGSTPLYPFFVDDTLYLPLRSVGERMGKDVIWLPTSTETHYMEELISVDTPSTPEQRAEMKSYVDQCFQLYWKASALAEELAAAGDMPPQQAAETLVQIRNSLAQMGALTEPTHTFLKKYEIQDSALSPISFMVIDEVIQYLQSGEWTFQQAKDTGVGLLSKVNLMLHAWYRTLCDAQFALDTLTAAKGDA